jgi:hypothetical protein
VSPYLHFTILAPSRPSELADFHADAIPSMPPASRGRRHSCANHGMLLIQVTPLQAPCTFDVLHSCI